MITKEMTISEIIKQYPKAVDILMSNGMGCLGCPSAQSEPLSMAAEIHGLELEKLLVELNNA
jgi:hybrid cluster-associated redox disulfide protein